MQSLVINFLKVLQLFKKAILAIDLFTIFLFRIYFQTGASGLHIEDQVFPKRCGHLDGKALVSKEDFAKKVQIAVNASKECSDG